MSRPGPPEIPQQADERTTLVAFLDYYRAALVDRAFGMQEDGFSHRLEPSTLTFGNLLTHMAWVEQHWFRNRFDGDPLSEPWASLDWSPGTDPEMAIAETMSNVEILDAFNFSVDDSRRRISGAVSLDQDSALPGRNGEHWNLRWIMVHMIEEYARHCGHADLIRESFDGNKVDGF